MSTNETTIWHASTLDAPHDHSWQSQYIHTQAEVAYTDFMRVSWERAAAEKDKGWSQEDDNGVHRRVRESEKRESVRQIKSEETRDTKSSRHVTMCQRQTDAPLKPRFRRGGSGSGRAVTERKGTRFVPRFLSLSPVPALLSFLPPSRSFSHLIENPPSGLGVDLVVLCLDISDRLLTRLLVITHPGGSLFL